MKKPVFVKQGKSIFFTDADFNGIDQKKLIRFVMTQLASRKSAKKRAAGSKNLARARAVLKVQREKERAFKQRKLA